jgi:LPXTG-motif cell wall-anchored protein
MKRKIYSYLSISVLINSALLLPITQVFAEDLSQTNKQNEYEVTSESTENSTSSSITEADNSYMDDIQTVDSSQTEDASTDNTSPSETESSTASSRESTEITSSSEQSLKAIESSTVASDLIIDTWMPDKNLQNIVASELNKDVAEISQEDLMNLIQVDFSPLPEDTEVSLLGLEYAQNLQVLKANSIIAKDIPEITMADSATLSTRPNVLKHITPRGKVSSIQIGSYSTNISTEELDGVGTSLVGWNVTNLTIYTQNMIDFSVLNLPIETQQNSNILINTIESVKLKALEIKDNSTTNILYKDTLAKDTNGNPMLSTLSNRMYSFNIVCFTKSGGLSFLEENADYQFTDNGIEFLSLPDESDRLLLHSTMPNRSILGRSDNSTQIQYGLNYEIPINYVVSGGNITVRYINDEGDSIEPNKTLTGNVGETYNTEELDIPGYKLKEVQGASTGTFSEEAQEIVYVYERSDAAAVTVKYQDSEGNQLSDPTVLSGKVGLPYESTAKEIAGWYVVETPNNATGTFSEEAQEVVYVYERSDAAAVTVKYQDSEGNQLSDPTVLRGKVGLPYESTAKEIAGWYVVETPNNATGTFSEEAQEVVYVYERSDAAAVTVKYQDSEGNQLSDPTVLRGKVGLPYESTAKEIAGWYVVETPNNATGTFSEEAQEVVYVYERSDAAAVTVKYQDFEGNQLSDPTVLSGKIGLPYESTAKEIAGWYVVETPSNATGTFSEEAQEVVYVYERSDAAAVTVKYQDSEGNQLSDPTVLSGKIGLPYESTAKEIAGWYVVETPSNATGTFSEEAQEVVYVYERSDAAAVTVKYQDSEGNQLSDPTVLSGKIGLPYESTAKEIAGWYVVETPNNATGTFSEEAQEVVYVYERSDAAAVTVKYQDSEGNQLSDPTVLSGKIGLPYESTAKEIAGWYVVETPSNATGTFSEEAQEVVYVYERSDAAAVTVKYQDSEGNQLSDPTVLSGKIGLPYESTAKEIAGWYVVETPSNATGTFSEEAQEVVYVYERVENNIDEKSSDNKPSSGKNNDSSQNLPNTGEVNSSQLFMSALGSLLLLFFSIITLKRKKHK